MMVRAGEKEHNWFRSDRMMHVNDQWYFVTRENTQEGPFDSKEEAEMELILFLRYASTPSFKQA